MAKKVEVKVKMEPKVKLIPVQAKMEYYPYDKDEGVTVNFFEGGLQVVAIQSGVFLPVLDITWEQVDEARRHVTSSDAWWNV